jgi:hypothetical protein
MDDAIRTLLAALAGGGLDSSRLDADVRSQARTIAELALLWEADVAMDPPAPTFSAAWDDGCVDGP